MTRYSAWWVLGLATACAVPYEPLRAEVSSLPDDAYERVIGVVRDLYHKIAVADEPGFRVQSRWVPHDDGRAGQRRATVFVENAELNVIVETRYLGIDLLGEASWSSARGDARLERELMRTLRSVLGV